MPEASTPIDPTEVANVRKRHAQAYFVLYTQEWEKDNTLTPEKFHQQNHEKHAALVTKAKAAWDQRAAAKGGK